MPFPAVEVEGRWYGDGGLRLTSPLAPAIHLGADRILAVSTRYGRSVDEAQALEEAFLHQASALGFRFVAGHPLAGGMRASIYNGVPHESVERLADFMAAFRRQHA